MYLYPDLDTWTVFPWGDENGSVAGHGAVSTAEGEPFAGDPRGNLKRALSHMEEVGFKSFSGQSQNSSYLSWMKMETQRLK